MMPAEQHQHVRTTLTLDPDVDPKLRTEGRHARKPFRQVVNDCLRVGLNARKQELTAKPYVVKARLLGLKPGYSY